MLPPFPGFTPATFDFLRDLAANNDRAWFQPRKATFEHEVRDPLVLFVASFLDEARRRGLPYAGVPEKALFRIYRDTRFSTDKTPYKTRASAWVSPSGTREASGGFYVRIAPGGCLLAVGHWHLEGPALRQVRQRFADDPALGDDLAARMAALGATFGADGEALKRLPRGFEAYADSAAAPYLRWKNIVATLPVAEADTFDPAFAARAAAFAEAAMPVLDLGG